MQKEMTNEQKDKYILHLENEVERLNKINDSLNYDKLSTVLKAQEDFLICQYADNDNLKIIPRITASSIAPKVKYNCIRSERFTTRRMVF